MRECACLCILTVYVYKPNCMCIHVCIHTCDIAYIYRNMQLCVGVYVQSGTPPSCLPDSTYSPFTLLCSFSPPPSSSYASLHPSSPSHSARLARTCMSVDSVLCLLLWHAPTSLQCSPVCINWQRDSGYVVCRAGRIEKREKGKARGALRTQ